LRALVGSFRMRIITFAKNGKCFPPSKFTITSGRASKRARGFPCDWGVLLFSADGAEPFLWAE